MKIARSAAHLAMLGANLLWGLMSPLSKSVLGAGVMTPFTLTTLRMTGAAALFWLASLFVRREHVPPRDLALLFFASLLGITLNQTCFIAGVSLTSPVNASVVTTTAPILTLVIAAFYLKEPVTAKKLIGILLGALGALLLILSGNSGAGGTEKGGVAGDLLCLAAQVSFAVYYVVFKQLIGRYSPVTLMKWMFTYAVVCCVPFSYTSLALLDWNRLSPALWGDLAFIVGGATFLSYLLIPVGQKRLRPTVASMYNYVQPVVASLLAVYWGMDAFGFPKLLAVGLVFAGVYAVSRSKSRAQLEAEAAARSAGGKEGPGTGR